MSFPLSRPKVGDFGVPDWLVVGLGNPGRRYKGTRHNIGFKVIDRIAQNGAVTLDRLEYQALTGRISLGKANLILAKPMTFMNLSGEAVCGLVAGKKIDIQYLIILHDEVEFPLGTLRIKTGGGAGGHNGLKSIIDRLGRSDFIRVRIGIGRPQKESMVDYVLSRVDPNDKEQEKEMVIEAAEVVQSIMDAGVGKAMNDLHGRKDTAA